MLIRNFFFLIHFLSRLSAEKSLNYKVNQDFKIGANDGSPGDNYGRSVASCEDVIVIGAYADKYRGVKSGSAYIYSVQNEVRSELLAKISPQEGNDDDYFGWSVSCDRNTTVVGAYGDDRLGEEAGAVYLFSESSSGKWIEVATLIAKDGSAGSFFGWAVTIYNGVILVGAIGHDGYGIDSGLVYSYIHYPNEVTTIKDDDDNNIEAHNWVLEAVISPSDASPYAYFGWSLDMYKENTIISAPWTEQRQGTVYIFNRNVSLHDFDDDSSYQYEMTAYHQQCIIEAPMRHSRDFFGSAVAIHKHQLIIGAYLTTNNNNINSGAAYIYQYKNNQCQFIQKLTGSIDTNQITYFGYAVDIYDNIIFVGAPGSPDSSNSSIHIFNKNERSNYWELTLATRSPDKDEEYTQGSFGVSIAMTSELTVVGSSTGTGLYESGTGAIFLYFNTKSSMVPSRFHTVFSSFQPIDIGLGIVILLIIILSVLLILVIIQHQQRLHHLPHNHPTRKQKQKKQNKQAPNDADAIYNDLYSTDEQSDSLTSMLFSLSAYSTHSISSDPPSSNSSSTSIITSPPRNALYHTPNSQLSRPSFFTSQPLPYIASRSIQDNLIRNISNDILNTSNIHINNSKEEEEFETLSNQEEDSRYAKRKLFTPFSDVSDWFTNHSRIYSSNSKSSNNNSNHPSSKGSTHLQHQATSLSKKRKTCKLCYCRFRALHLHGKSKSSKLLCQLLQSIRAQLLPLQLSNFVDPDTTQTSNSPSN